MDNLVNTAYSEVFGRSFRRCKVYCIVGMVVGCLAYNFLSELGVFLIAFHLGCLASILALIKAIRRNTATSHYQREGDKIKIEYLDVSITANTDDTVLKWLDPEAARNVCVLTLPPIVCKPAETEIEQQQDTSE